MPKVSIIISIYNVANYLSTSVSSAIEQSEKDIEILLVDDGSTDESGKLCDEFALQDTRIKVIHKPNGGLSSARNAGVAAATAEYVLLLDGDDYLHRQAVESLWTIVERYPADVVQFFYQELDEVVELPPVREELRIAQTNTARDAFENLYQFGGVYASGCTKLFRRELLQEIPFETIRHEDEMWCTRAFEKPLTITYFPAYLYGYVAREGSIIRGGFQKSRMEILTVKEERLRTLRRLELFALERQERERLFAVLFTLYKDAAMAKDTDAKREIVRYFKDNEVLKSVKITGRMKPFYLLAKLNLTCSLKAYAAYWKMKG